MRQHVGGLCILFMVLCVGLAGGFALRDHFYRPSMSATSMIPPVVVSGADATYSVGDIVTLSIKPFSYPTNLLQLGYYWKVVDPNQPNKNVIRSKDNTTISFGTGSKPGKITVIVDAAAVMGTKDVSGNITAVDLQSSGMSSFDIVVK